MGLGTAIMGGIGLAGSLLSSNAQKKAAKKAAEAAQFNPWNASNLFGSTTWNRQSNQIQQSLSPFAQGIADQLQGQAQAGLGSAWQAQGDALMGSAAGDLMGAYQQAQGLGGLDPAFANSIMGGFYDLYGRSAPQVSVQGINPYMLGAVPQVSAQNTAGVDMSGLFSSAGNNPYALEQMQMGRNLMGNSYQDVADQQLALMRQQAAPHEERATNSLMQRLFNQGRMGSTGGGRDIEAFARGLGEADLSRQLAANQFAEGLYGRDQALGANLFSGGAGLFQQGQGLAANIGSNINAQNLARDQYNLGAGQFNAQLGLQAALANQGAAMQAGTANMDAALRAAMANQSASLQGNQQALAALTGGANFGLTQDQLNYSRANDRIARAEALFGFGNALGQVGMNQTANALSLLSGLAGQQNDLANLGIAAGGAQATAGANAGRFTLSAAGSPLGGFMQGLGGAYLSSDQAQNQIFNFMSKL